MASRPKDSAEVQEGEALSKREQRKLELALKRFEDFEPKPKKKRKINEKTTAINYPSELFDSKTPDSCCKLDETENFEEAKEFPQNPPPSARPVPPRGKIQVTPSKSQLMACHYNQNYKIENGVEGLFQYLLTYEMEQLKKKEEKEDALRAGIDIIGGLGKPIAYRTCPESAALLAKLGSVTAPRGLGEKLSLFSKAHRAMSETIQRCRE